MLVGSSENVTVDGHWRMARLRLALVEICATAARMHVIRRSFFMGVEGCSQVNGCLNDRMARKLISGGLKRL